MHILSREGNSEHWWDIYKITNPLNQSYVGVTSNIKKRLSNYKYLCGRVKKQPLIYASLLEYGFENHKIEIIDSFQSSIAYAHGKEQFWIRSCMSNRNKYSEVGGLNLSDGGQGTKGVKLSEEMKERIGKRNRGKPMHENSRKSLDEYYKNNPYPKFWQGKKMPKVMTDKMSMLKKGKPIAHLIGIKTTDEKVLNISASKKGSKPKNKGIKYTEEQKIKLAATRNTTPVPILVYDKNTNELLHDFKSANQVAKFLGLGRACILRRFLNGVNEYVFLNFIIKKK